MRLMCDKKHEYYFLQGCVGKRVLKHLEAKFECSLGFEGSAKNTFGLFRFHYVRRWKIVVFGNEHFSLFLKYYAICMLSIINNPMII